MKLVYIFFQSDNRGFSREELAGEVSFFRATVCSKPQLLPYFHLVSRTLEVYRDHHGGVSVVEAAGDAAIHRRPPCPPIHSSVRISMPNTLPKRHVPVTASTIGTSMSSRPKESPSEKGKYRNYRYYRNFGIHLPKPIFI